MEYTIHNQTFGLELEFGKISKEKAVRVLESFFNTNSEPGTGARYLQERFVRDNKGRKWSIVRDGSVNIMDGSTDEDGDPRKGGNELVTPPLMFEDIETLQELVRKLRRAGAKVDESCGIHIHVGLQPYTAKSLKNLIKFYGKYEDMFYKSVQVLPNREQGFTKKLVKQHPLLVNGINKAKTMDDIEKLWYNGYSSREQEQHYSQTRYSGLNLHNIWYKGWYSGTVEFRFFNSTLHAGKIRSYITLILAISTKALNAKTVNMRQAQLINDEHLFPKVLGGMGILAKDKKMKNVYKHLMKHMEREWASA